MSEDLPLVVADFKRKFDQLEAQMSILQPIAAKMVSLLSKNKDVALALCHPDYIDTPEILIKSFAMNATKQSTKEDWTLEKQATSVKNSEDSLKSSHESFGFESRDRVFDHAEEKEKVGNMWKLLVKGNKGQSPRTPCAPPGSRDALYAESRASLRYSTAEETAKSRVDIAKERFQRRQSSADEYLVTERSEKSLKQPTEFRKLTGKVKKDDLPHKSSALKSSQFGCDDEPKQSNDSLSPSRYSPLPSRKDIAHAKSEVMYLSAVSIAATTNSPYTEIPEKFETNLQITTIENSKLEQPMVLGDLNPIQNAEVVVKVTDVDDEESKHGTVGELPPPKSVFSNDFRQISNTSNSENLAEAGQQSGLYAQQRRRRTSLMATALFEATTAPKYNVKGSLASSIDKLEISKRIDLAPDEEPELEAGLLETVSRIWKIGLNSLSSFSANADFLTSLVLLSVLWIAPFSVAYDCLPPFEYSVFVSVFYFVDLCLELITVRVSHKAMQNLHGISLKSWRSYYLRHGFIIDLLTIFPFELLSHDGAEHLLLLRMFRLYKLPSILRTSPKYVYALKIVSNLFGVGQSVAVIFPLLFAFCVFLHLQACTIFYGGRIFEFSNADIEPLEHSTVFDQYTWALFTAVGNTFPLAYRPTRSEERWITFMFIIAGAGLYASIVGAISSFAMGVDASGRLYKQKLDEVQEYMRWKDLGPTTRRKMLKYYELKYRGKFFEENTLLNEMNDSLRMEIAAHNCRELISKVSFLRREQNDGRDELFVGRIAVALTACFFVPGDIVITQGEMGNEMYFIMNGTVNVIAGGKRVTSFKDGAFFGEVALIANIPRTATVQGASSCMLYKLTRASFTSILDEFDDVRRKVEAIYHERMEKIRQEEEVRKLTTAKELVSKVTFLQRNENDGRDNELLKNIAMSLVAVFLATGETIFNQGQMGNELFFVKSGTVDVLVGGKKVTSLSDGAFFGEVALIANIPRTATVVAASPCMLYKLTRPAFMGILDEFEDMRKRVDVIYQERMEKVRQEEADKRRESRD
ncbi:cyclic nucleotide-binding-like protein [Obelidium mucronatum]|nr:cyclic nucleotide-binding-like protein [Obelidium mucronatum]